MKSWKERREDTLREFGVEIRDVPGCGRGLFARRDFEVGEIVLKESPLISLDLKEPLKRLDSPPIDGVPEEKRENLRIFLNYMKKLEAFLFQASLDTQEAMLDCYCGDDLQPTDSLLVRATSVANFCLTREHVHQRKLFINLQDTIPLLICIWRALVDAFSVFIDTKSILREVTGKSIVPATSKKIANTRKI